MKRRGAKRTVQHPLMCWDIASQAPFRQRSFYEISEFTKAYKKHRWDFTIPTLEEKDFETIVITAPDETIIWVSPGFSKMTGYTSRFAIGKRPGFLQGIKSEEEVKRKIRTAIELRREVAATITNYRKDGTKYFCHVAITPLYSSEKLLVGFMALEREI